MSRQCFLVTDKQLTKTSYEYKYILPEIAEGDMFYNDGISFENNLSEQESEAIGNLFKNYNVYAIYSGFHLDYDPRYKTVLSEKDALNCLDELLWLRDFAYKKLQKQKVFMIASFWLGRPTAFKTIKTVNIKLKDWNLNEETSFEFKMNTVYKFSL